MGFHENQPFNKLYKIHFNCIKKTKNPKLITNGLLK